jgi:hypothetical protein
MKMTKANYTTIHSANWKPFEDVMVQFLRSLEETSKIRFFQQTSSLHEYVSICEKNGDAGQQKLLHNINPSMAAG